MTITGIPLPFPGIQLREISAKLIKSQSEETVRQCAYELGQLSEQLLQIGREHRTLKACADEQMRRATEV